MESAQGRCLCGQLRYRVDKPPGRTTICHCKFCQRATGGAYMVEPIFDRQDFSVTNGTAKTYTHRSEGSGKLVHIHFCDTCGTKITLTFERFPEIVGLYAGTFDDPNWFDLTPATSKHIFLGVAQRGTIIPAFVNTFVAHATGIDGTPIDPEVFETPHVIGTH
ncbi:GFA family protein [Flavimaricola marinus]|uniref:Glutathione-dependent formaldehyde-activating enzyme n=1 Tax=Flavimaricola marinus TaxID=1819565 RepID=A0A238LAT1_9RHOB|nr:GFA family protein [Flavimaricola marinus]SMY06738.1 Glutathione-dependent formaldehyde-activating enzyme [Flavimaricola marinus]